MCMSWSSDKTIARPLIMGPAPRASWRVTSGACQIAYTMAIVWPLDQVTNPHVSPISSPIAAIITLIDVVVPVVAISHAP